MRETSTARISLPSGASHTGATSSLTPASVFVATDAALTLGEMVVLTLFDARVDARVVFVSPAPTRGVVLMFDAPPALRASIAAQLAPERPERRAARGAAAEDQDDLLGSETIRGSISGPVPENSPVLIAPEVSVTNPVVETLAVANLDLPTEPADEDDTAITATTIRGPNVFEMRAAQDPSVGTPSHEPGMGLALGKIALRADPAEPEIEAATHRTPLTAIASKTPTIGGLFDSSTQPSSDLAPQPLDFGPAVHIPPPKRTLPPARARVVAGPPVDDRVNPVNITSPLELDDPPPEPPPRVPTATVHQGLGSDLTIPAPIRLSTTSLEAASPAPPKPAAKTDAKSEAPREDVPKAQPAKVEATVSEAVGATTPTGPEGGLPVLGSDGVTLRFASHAQYATQYKANIQHGGIIAKATPLAIGTQRFVGMEIPGRPRYTISLRVTFLGEGTVGFTIDSFALHRNQLRSFLES